MKNIYFIGGTMGVGKTTVSRVLEKTLPACVFLDGDWCWDMHPFIVTDETKKMVEDNICHLLNNFIKCTAYENIVFCWVMHEQAIIDGLLSMIDTRGCEVRAVSLVCDEKTLRSRLQNDVERGLRAPDIVSRSVARIPFYMRLDTSKLDVSGLTPEETAQKIISAELYRPSRHE